MQRIEHVTNAPLIAPAPPGFKMPNTTGSNCPTNVISTSPTLPTGCSCSNGKSYQQTSPNSGQYNCR
jgi:hypothetical protein